jgi:tetratricopeptide (TPR) repeat protein
MGDIARAISTAETITEPFAIAAALIRIGEAQAKAGELQAARDTLQRATAAVSAIAGPSSHSWQLIQIARAYVAVGDRETAEELLQAALAAAHRGERAATLVWMSEVQTEMGAVEVAVATAEKIEDIGIDGDNTREVSEIQSPDGTVIWMPAEMFSPKPFGNHDRAMSQIVEAQVKAGNLSLALEIAKKMRDAYWRVNRLADMAKARAEVADREGARTIIAAAAGAIEQIEDDKWRASATVDVAEVYAMVGDVAAAIATATPITEQGYWTHALFRIAAGLAKSGVPAAMGQISDHYAHAIVLAHLAKWQVEGVDRSAGLRSIGAAQIVAEGIDQPLLRGEALLRIAEAQVSAGDVTGVRQTLAKAAALIGMPDNAERRDSMAVTVAEAQANAGDFVAAVATATGISDPDSRAHVLVHIAEEIRQ